MKNKNDNEKIREKVDEFYQKIFDKEYKTHISPEKISESLGYNQEMLKQLPEEADTGLSCGNPLENLILNDGETLIDLGCGTGKDIFLTRMKYPNSGILYGMDRLEDIIKKAEKI